MPIASSPSKQRGGPAVTHAITAPKGTSAGADGSASSSNAGSSSSVFAPGGLMAGQAAAASTAAATTSTNSEMTALASFKKDLEDEARIEGRLIVYEVSIMYDQLRRVEASISGPWCFLGQQDEAQWMEEEHWRCIPPTVVSFMTHKVPTEEVKFSSAFESANLYFVEKTADHVFRCELQFDPVAELVGPPTRRSLSSSASSTGEDFGPGPVAQWFYFAVYGGRNCAGRNVRYEVPNLSRLKAAQLLATHQKGPLFWSSHHPTWYGNRTKNVTVSNTDPEIAKDVLSRQGFEFRPDVSELATLSFEYTFTHDNETIFFAYGLPYTHTHLRRFLKWSCAFATLDADSTYGGGGGSGKADKDAVSITREELCLSRGRFPVDIVRITRGRDFQHPDDEDDSFVSSDSSEDEAEPAASVYLPSIAENGAGRSGGAESTAGGAASATTSAPVGSAASSSSGSTARALDTTSAAVTAAGATNSAASSSSGAVVTSGGAATEGSTTAPHSATSSNVTAAQVVSPQHLLNKGYIAVPELPRFHMQTRKVIAVVARQTAGDTSSSWVMQGFMRFLLGASVRAKRLRLAYDFVFLPMANVDGVVAGHTRCSGYSCPSLQKNWRQNLAAKEKASSSSTIRTSASAGSSASSSEAQGVAGLLGVTGGSAATSASLPAEATTTASSSSSVGQQTRVPSLDAGATGGATSSSSIPGSEDGCGGGPSSASTAVTGRYQPQKKVEPDPVVAAFFERLRYIQNVEGRQIVSLIDVEGQGSRRDIMLSMTPSLYSNFAARGLFLNQPPPGAVGEQAAAQSGNTGRRGSAAAVSNAVTSTTSGNVAGGSTGGASGAAGSSGSTTSGAGANASDNFSNSLRGGGEAPKEEEMDEETQRRRREKLREFGKRHDVKLSYLPDFLGKVSMDLDLEKCQHCKAADPASVPADRPFGFSSGSSASSSSSSCSKNSSSSSTSPTKTGGNKSSSSAGATSSSEAETSSAGVEVKADEVATSEILEDASDLEEEEFELDDVDDDCDDDNMAAGALTPAGSTATGGCTPAAHTQSTASLSSPSKRQPGKQSPSKIGSPSKKTAAVLKLLSSGASTASLHKGSLNGAASLPKAPKTASTVFSNIRMALAPELHNCCFFTLEVSMWGVTSLTSRAETQRKRSRPYQRAYGRPAMLDYLQAHRDFHRFFGKGTPFCSIRLGSFGLALGLMFYKLLVNDGGRLLSGMLEDDDDQESKEQRRDLQGCPGACRRDIRPWTPRTAEQVSWELCQAARAKSLYGNLQSHHRMRSSGVLTTPRECRFSRPFFDLWIALVTLNLVENVPHKDTRDQALARKAVAERPSSWSRLKPTTLSLTFTPSSGGTGPSAYRPGSSCCARHSLSTARCCHGGLLPFDTDDLGILKKHMPWHDVESLLRQKVPKSVEPRVLSKKLAWKFTHEAAIAALEQMQLVSAANAAAKNGGGGASVASPIKGLFGEVVQLSALTEQHDHHHQQSSSNTTGSASASSGGGTTTFGSGSSSSNIDVLQQSITFSDDDDLPAWSLGERGGRDGITGASVAHVVNQGPCSLLHGLPDDAALSDHFDPGLGARGKTDAGTAASSQSVSNEGSAKDDVPGTGGVVDSAVLTSHLMRKLHGSNMHPGLNAAVSRALDSSDGKVGLQTVCPPGASGMMSSVPENEMTDAQSAGGAGGANLSQQFQSTFSDGLGEQLQQDLVSQMLADPGLAKRVRWEELPVSSQQLLKSEVAQLNCKAVSALGDGARVYVREPKQALRTMTSALLCPDAVPQNTPRKTVWSTSSSSKATTTVSAMLQDAEIAASGSIASSFDPTHVPPSSLVQAVTVPLFRQAEAAQQLSNTFRSSLAKSGAGRIDIEHVMRTRSRAGAAVRDLYIDEFESSGDEQQNSLAPEFEYDSDDQLRKNVKRLVRDYVDISDDDDEFCSDEDETSMSKTARTTGDAESLADSKAETVPYQASKNFNFGSSCNASIIGSQRPRSAASYHRMGVREVRKLQALSYYKQMLLCPMQKRGMYKRRRLKKTDRFMGSESFQRLASGVRSLVRDKNKKQGSSPNKDDAAAWNRAGGPLGLPTRLTKGSFLGSRGIAETQQNRIDQQNNATWWQIARGQVSLDSLHQSGVSVSDPSKLDEVLRETFQQQQLAKPGENKIKGSYPNAGGINKDNISSLPLDGTDATGQHLYGMCDVESPLYLNSQGGLEPPPGAGGASGQQHQQQHQHQAGVENAVLAAARKRRALQTPNTPYRASPWGSLPSALSPMDQMHQQATGNGMSPALREIAETGQGVSPGGAQGRLRDIASRSGKVMLTRNRKSGNMQIHRLGSAGNAIPIGATTGNSFHEVGGGPAFPNSTGGGAGSSSGACWPQGPSTSPLVTEGGTMLGLGNFEDAINTRRLVCSGNQTKSITGSATASGSNSVTVEGALERGGGRRNSHSSSGNRGGDDSRSPGVSLVEQMGAEQSTEVSVSSSTSNSPAKNALSPNTRSPNRAAHKRGIFVHQGSPAKMASKRRYSSGLHKSPAPAAGKESSTLVQHAEVEQHNPNYSTGDDKATSRSTTAAPTSSSASAVGDSSELQQQVYPETEAARFAGWTKTDEAAQPQECPAAVVAGPNEDRVGEKKTQDEQHREGGAPDYQKSDTRNAAHQLTQDMSQSVSVIVGETAMVVDNMQASHKTTEEPSAASSFFRNDSEDLYTNTTTSSSSTGGANHKSQKHQIAASKHLQPAAVTLDAVETSTVLKPHLFDGHQTGETSTALKPHLFDGSRPVGRRKGRDKVAQQTPGGELNSGFSSEVEFCSSELRTQSEGDQMKVTSTTTGSGGRNTTNAGPGDGPSAASFSSSRCTSSGVSGGLQPGVVEGGARVTRSSSHSKNGRAGGGSKFLDYLQTKRSTAAKLVSESIHSLSNKNGIHDPEERAGAAYAVGSDMGSDGGYHNADNTLNAEVENRGAALSGSSVEGSTHLDAGRSTDLDTAAIELLHTGHLGAGVQQQGSSSSSSRVFRGEVGFDIAVDDFPKSAAHQLRANIMHSPDEDRGEHDDEDAIGSVSSIAAGASSSVLHSMNTRLGERMQSLRSQFSEPRRSERSVLGSSLKKTASRHYSGAPGGGSPSKRNFY